MYLQRILSILASMEPLMKTIDLNKLTFSYTSLLVSLSTCISLTAHATTSEQPYLSTDYLYNQDSPKPYYAPAGQRLGAWLPQQLTQDANTYYESALVWQSNVEQIAQQAQKQQLISTIKQLASVTSHRQLTPLYQWLDGLPVTGRVVLPKQDLAYLQVNPQIDPLFQQGDRVTVHQRPNYLTVLFDDAQTCRVTYQAGVRSKDYIDSCLRHLSKTINTDSAYLISPQGLIEPISLAAWNAKYQSTPAAGAWIWVADKQHQWPDELVLDVANFLATQSIDLPLPKGQSPTPIPLDTMKAERSRDLPVSASDWGVTGLLQTPSARMQPQGVAGLHISHIDPYTQYNLLLQPFDWLETAVRYTNVDGVSYGPVSPEQDLKDKSIDVKMRLLQESRWLPQLAVGWRDPAGTSLFGGEYIVANKRYADFDFSLGIGWGYLGARQNIANPFTAIDQRFTDRVADKSGQGGELSPKSWFTGRASLFGGVQWHTPYDPLTVKIEYDGNDYRSEPHSNQDLNPKDIPINIGATWQDSIRGIALSGGLERGDTWMLGLTLQGDLSELGQRKPPAPAILAARKTPMSQLHNFSYQLQLPNQKHTSAKNEQILQAFSAATGWHASQLSIDTAKQVHLQVEVDDGVFIQERLKEGMDVLLQVIPKDSKLIQIEMTRYGDHFGVFNIDPLIWKQQQQRLLPPSQRLPQPIKVTAAPTSANHPPRQIIAATDLSRGSVTISPVLHQSIGGPDGYLYGLYANANANYRLWDGAWLNGDVQARMIDNYDQYTYTADSNLPRVRTNIRNYMTTSDLLMPNLQWTQFKPLGDGWYGLAYAGYLERMFAGVGAEILYRQADKPWALGLDINRVRQREFDQHFDLQDYEVTTGNLSLYWNTPWQDIDMKLSAGQYLAGDKGVTIDLSRTFRNGVKMGGWVSKTDVSAEDFGEGSMDKGIYISLPFDALFKSWSPGYTQLVYQPLIRDGGAKLNRKYQLYQLTAPISDSALQISNPLSP